MRKRQNKSAQWALPPGCPAVEIDGEQYWDGGLVSNTPLQWVIDSNTRHEDMLASRSEREDAIEARWSREHLGMVGRE